MHGGLRQQAQVRQEQKGRKYEEGTNANQPNTSFSTVRLLYCNLRTRRRVPRADGCKLRVY